MGKDSIDIYIATSPVPYVYNGNNNHGIILSEDKYCSRCSDKTCLCFNTAGKYNKCKSGMMYRSFLFFERKLVIYGFSIKAEKFSRNAISQEIIEKWVSGLNDIVEYEFEQQKIMWSPFHDITPCISLIFRNIESIISKCPGKTIHEKIENSSDYNIVRLFKTVSLLDEQLKMIRYCTAEDQISSGKKSPFPVYRIIDKLCKIFQVLASENGVKISICGNSFNAPSLFDSFSSVPFILIDNAIKYTHVNESISIKISDSQDGGIEFELSSLSAKCDSQIFEKYHRGAFSNKLTDRGMGIGLYIARKICIANDAIISHEEEMETFQDGDVEYCRNTFRVII